MALTDQEKSFLPAEGEGAPLDGSGMNRSSSSRFHVENIVESNSVELNNTNPRKPSDSSNGRFQVAPHDPPSSNPAGKAVHFSVGDEHKPHRQDSSSTIENNTINHKSFRNVQTLEKPPIIDFYLNSSDADGGMVTRPSMIALLTGRPNEVVTLELDEFKRGLFKAEFKLPRSLDGNF
uniref:Uncharacterized protein n=1 Tax=Plectus sambesii TaxID=2011161 RepID=A0A914UVN4_9BILA